MEVNKLDITVVKNWAKRRGYAVDESTATALAQKSLEQINSVAYDRLDTLWASRSAAPKPPGPAAPSQADKQNIRTMLNWSPRYANVRANEDIVLDTFIAKSLPVTVENFNAIFPAVVSRLTVSESWQRAFADFFQKFPQFASGEANVQLMERSLRGADVTLEALVDLTDVGNPDYCADRLALSAYGKEQQSAERQQKADKREKKELIEQLTAGMLDASGRPLNTIATTNRAPKAVYDAEIQRLSNLSLAELRKMAVDKAEVQRWRGMSPGELRKEVKQNFAPALQQYQPIPEKYKVPNKDIFLDWSKRMWASLPPEIMKHCLKLYGPEQINKACGLE